MSLETELKKLAAAMETLAAALLKGGQPMRELSPPVKEPVAPVADVSPPVAAPVAPVAPVAPAAPVAPPADVSPPVAPPAAPVTYTPEEVNGILLKEAQRLKGPTQIHAEMKRLGVTGVQSATAEQITALITAVQAIEA